MMTSAEVMGVASGWTLTSQCAMAVGSSLAVSQVSDENMWNRAFRQQAVFMEHEQRLILRCVKLVRF